MHLMKIADLYIRVSTDEQADKGYSQRDQEERLRRYCELHQIAIGQVIFEDHSAKNFNRPEWIKLLSRIKQRGNKTNLILFTKWDRFSRNAGDAYQMISMLTKSGVEPQAIEQPLDLSIPENKMMLAIYLAAPEVENDRRALNVFYGMRRAKKEGRVMGIAPFGYINRISEDGKQKFIVPKEPEASTMKYVFNEIVKQIEAPEVIRKRILKSGKKMLSPQAFHVAIRNPVYCGKVFIGQYKDEPPHFVKGLHEPIIDEALFNEVQDTLDGNRRASRPPVIKLTSHEKLPLRGFLLCPKCGAKLTGSGSKGRKEIYFYYHCNSRCGVRFIADNANKLFLEELRQYEFNAPVQKIIRQVVLNAHKQIAGNINDSKKQIADELDGLNQKLSIARNKLLSEAIDDEDYQVIKSELKPKIEQLEQRLQQAGRGKAVTGLETRLDRALSAVSSISWFYNSSSIETKRSIIGSMFPENLVFDGKEYRTTRLNTILKCILITNNQLNHKKNRNHLNFSGDSCLVVPTRIEQRLMTRSCIAF